MCPKILFYAYIPSFKSVTSTKKGSKIHLSFLKGNYTVTLIFILREIIIILLQYKLITTKQLKQTSLIFDT